MTKKERVLAALEGRPVDRVPVSFWRHITGSGGGPALGRESAREHLAFYRQTGLDFIKIMQDGFTAPFDPCITAPAGLERIRPEDGRHPFVRDYLERARWVNELMGGEVHTYCNVFSPFMLLRKIGDDVLHRLIREDEGAVIRALDAVAGTLCAVVEGLIRDCGCLGVFLCFQGADRFTPEDYRRIVAPSDRKVLDCANRCGDYNIAHFCAWDGGKNDLELWRDYPARAVNWAIHIDGHSLGEGRRYFGGRTVLGGFDNRTGGLLFTAGEAAVRGETRRILQDYQRETGGLEGLILGADCSFLPPFALERFRWVTDEAQQWQEEQLCKQ